ncbi:MAG: type II toxin-antitoxin system Phd/YefM family antitoxin [Candidatus Omnitrophica bacterium]|nr:type II toxin-antitoxin system Phd/YefM family antitoxin [Candidatus Omnitrophota bacterium]
MVNMIPLTELRPRLPDVMDRVSKYMDRFVITRHGRPEAVLMSQDDYESIMETIEILSNPGIVREIREGIKEAKAGKGIPWEKAKKDLGYDI